MATKYNLIIPSRMPIIPGNRFDRQQIRLLISFYRVIFNILLHIFIQPYIALFYLSYVQQTTDDIYYGLGILVHIGFFHA
jgi:pyruvate-formate lyase-activating enzyme